jgi:hypothetical protein
MDHRIETHALGARDLTSLSTRLAGVAAGLLDGGDGQEAAEVDVAELHAPFAHQELILLDALGSIPGDDVSVNPSGGALWPPTGSWWPVSSGSGRRPAGSWTGRRDGAGPRHLGPCLQQNLVCALAAEPALRGRS